MDYTIIVVVIAPTFTDRGGNISDIAILYTYYVSEILAWIL